MSNRVTKLTIGLILDIHAILDWIVVGFLLLATLDAGLANQVSPKHWALLGGAICYFVLRVIVYVLLTKLRKVL